MEKLTYEEIVKKFKELDITPEMFYCNDYDEEQKEFVVSLGESNKVYGEGGNEGGGEYFERVFYFKDHDVYIQITGYYESNNGTECDEEFNQVFPRRVIDTVYETEKGRGDKTDEA